MTIAPVPVDEAVPGPRPELPDDSLLALYREMVRVRAFEEEVIDAFGKGLIPGSTHPCIGAEAIKAGALSPLAADDLVFATYRGHGEALIKGVEPVSMMAELMGRATGVCKGKGGSMHLSEPSVGLVSTNAIVAGHIPMAGGAALSCQFRRIRPGRALLLRRRRLVRGRVLRDHEHGDALEGPARLHLREQRHRDLRPDLEEPGDARHRRPRPRLRDAGVDRRRQRRRRGARGGRRGRRARPGGRRPDVRGVQDRPLGAALRVLRRGKRSGGAAPRLAAGRPDPAFPEGARLLGPRDGRRPRRSRRAHRAPRCARSATRRSAPPSRRPTPSTRTSLRRNAGCPRPAPRAQP